MRCPYSRSLCQVSNYIITEPLAQSALLMWHPPLPPYPPLRDILEYYQPCFSFSGTSAVSLTNSAPPVNLASFTSSTLRVPHTTRFPDVSHPRCTLRLCHTFIARRVPCPSHAHHVIHILGIRHALPPAPLLFLLPPRYCMYKSLIVHCFLPAICIEQAGVGAGTAGRRMKNPSRHFQYTLHTVPGVRSASLTT